LTPVRRPRSAPIGAFYRGGEPIARTTRTGPGRKAKTSPVQNLVACAEKILEDGKAEDIVVIDLRKKSDIADYLLIATGHSQRQVAALAQHLTEGLKEAGHGTLAVEGLRHGEWVLVDAGDVVIHLFRPETRTYYNLEKMWGETFSEAVGQS
jgi:ribosome silencing factor RsfS/YbeB/iojap